MKRRTIGVVLLVVLWGCASTPPLPVDRARPPAPRLDLAGQSLARKVEGSADVPAGPGAEGRHGDWLIENAFVRFVIGSVHRTLEGGQGGNLIDAAMQGGQDRMRLRIPELGSRPRLWPVYTSLRVEEAGGPDTPASIVAEGHLPGRPKVKVVTTYTLEPDARMLEMRTRVENGTDEVLPGFSLGDRLYQGRTLRYVPGTGLCPIGRTSSAHWVAFFGGGYVWGVLGPVLAPTEGVHGTGSSELTYATTDLGPGQAREYRRFVLADFGGPEKVWLAADPVPAVRLCSVRVILTDEASGVPLAGGLVFVRPAGARPEFLAPAGDDGVVEFQVPAARYEMWASAPGRPRSMTRALDCLAGTTAVWPIPLAPQARVRIGLRGQIGGIVAPLTGRVSVFPIAGAAVPATRGPGFPVQPPADNVLVRGGEAARLPLAPAGAHLSASYLLAASKGPLFNMAVARFDASAGEDRELNLELERTVDPVDYVAVDLCQFTGASPDCSLSLQERALADASEGLQGAVAADPVMSAARVAPPPDAECALMPGLRLERNGQGSFSVFPLDLSQNAAAAADLMEPGLSAAEALQRARRLFPDALVQVDQPLDPSHGYLVLGQFDRGTGLSQRPGFSDDFDALQVLSGGDVGSARDVLPYWFAMLNAGKKVLATGGSRSQGIGGGQDVLARTFVYCPTGGARPSEPQLVAALHALKDAPNAFVTNGPFISATLNKRPIGSRQTVKDGRAELSLRVYAPNWVDVRRVRVYRNGQVVQDLPVPASTEPLRLQKSLVLEVPEDSWFVVLVEGRRPLLPVYGAGGRAPTPFAVTNPFWVETEQGKD